MISSYIHKKKQLLKAQRTVIGSAFLEHQPITDLMQKWVLFIDSLLIKLFKKHQMSTQFCLLALGSFGRQELQLFSDIDILLLHLNNSQVNNFQETDLLKAQYFIQDCWDLGLDLSHQVTTVSSCADLAAVDLTVISSLLDMRFLCGVKNLQQELEYAIHPLHMWGVQDYFFAKQQEQNQRHAKFNDTAHHLEPNIKYGVGGLRDIQIIFQITRRHASLPRIITEREYEILLHCQKELLSIRFALHQIAGKREDRLLFEYQIKLAAYFGYQDTASSLAIEQWMKHYFKLSKKINQINEMLLQWFYEVIIHHEKQHLKPLDSYTQLSNHDIELRHPKILHKYPEAIFHLFLWIAQDPTIRHIKASTIRHIHQVFPSMASAELQPKLTVLFFQILDAKNPYKALYLMSQYGILNHYMSSFGAVTGQMQYDLYHVYTVEQHTLFVIRNLTQFKTGEFPNSLCHELMLNISNQRLLYLAGLFHDIGKGRGGSHEEWGANEAQKYAVGWGMRPNDVKLLTWLVRNHLLMSHTAQRQDIYEPKTIEIFCCLFPEPYYLEYLYLLTVADICATNPALWNSWKDSLLKELYYLAKAYFQKMGSLNGKEQQLESKQKRAMSYLEKKGYTTENILALWQQIKTSYFFHESPRMIARHTQAILQAELFPLILIQPHYSQGGTEIFIYMPYRDDHFSITTTVLHNQQITIQEAFISTCHNSYNLDIYVVLDKHNQPILQKERIHDLKNYLHRTFLSRNSSPSIIQQRLSRQQAHFKIKPKIIFTNELNTNKDNETKLFIIASDRPGLLSKISKVFFSEKIILHHAKIATAGERVEDTFFISTEAGDQLSSIQQTHLKHELLKVLA